MSVVALLLHLEGVMEAAVVVGVTEQPRGEIEVGKQAAKLLAVLLF